MTARKIQPIPFRKLVTAGASGYMDFQITDYATVENVRSYFAQGQQLCLRVNPVIIQSGSEAPTPILSYPDGGNQYISGDNVTLDFDCARPITPYDIVRVYYNNTDSANSVNLAVDVTVDYYAGSQRVV